MLQYNLDVLGLSETKMRGNGMKDNNGTRYVYAGVSKGRARGRVGIAIAEQLINGQTLKISVWLGVDMILD